MMLMLTLIIAYLVGAIPVGYLIARLRGISDIREHGSGTIGATNVARKLGLPYFFLVFFLDFAKAYGLLHFLSNAYFLSAHPESCPELSRRVVEGPFLLFIVALALLIGNAFPIFLKFKGGKGVATSLGIMAALNPWIIPYDACIWFITVAITRTIGMGSVAGLIGLPIISVFILHNACYMQLLMLFMAVLGVWLHRTNIKKYLNTTDL